MFVILLYCLSFISGNTMIKLDKALTANDKVQQLSHYLLTLPRRILGLRKDRFSLKFVNLFTIMMV